MSDQILTREELAETIQSLLLKYHAESAILFGSYARGEATAESDVDLLVDTTGAGLDTLLKLGGLYSDLEDALEISIDLVTVDAMEQPTTRRSALHFREAVKQERKMIYAAA